MTTQYYLKLAQFEGPLDLLLHLIKVNEIDIFHIDIFKLTQQYLAYLRILKYDDLADAGEFIEMAATLIEIKTKMLLPGQENKTAEGLLSEDDPRYSLQERLIQYEMIKRAAEHLGLKAQFGVQLRSNLEWQRLMPIYEAIEAPLEGDPASLVILYEQLLRELTERKPPVKHEAKVHTVTMEEKIIELGKIIESVNFALFQGFYKTFQSRYELIVYILATLELCKSGRFKVHQEVMNGPLWIYRSDLDPNQLPLQLAQHTEILAIDVGSQEGIEP